MSTAHGAAATAVGRTSSCARKRHPASAAVLVLIALTGLGGLLPGCDDGPAGETQLGPARVVEPVGRRIRWNTAPGDRYGISARDFAGTAADASGGASMGGAVMPGDDAVGGLHWATPAGWKERPAAMFREANFYVAGDERAECYLTTLGGPAGGLEANVNRWRAQLSLAPLGSAEIAALPTAQWLGGTAVVVDVTGEWQGMSGEEAEADYRLVGLALVQPDASRFLKMIGPAEVIGREVDAFRALASSFHSGAGHAHDGVPGAVPPGLPADPADAQRTTDGPSAVPGSDAQGNASLTWRVPAGWTLGPEKSMREVTYYAGADRAVECYVTLLAGDGGGLLANINRWCAQMGAPVLGEADLVPLERVPMAGGEGVIVRLTRGPDATAAAGQDLLLGAVCQLPERALFVKMTGPAAAVEAQHAALVEFCTSLQAAR